jgi:hypothetical protein
MPVTTSVYATPPSVPLHTGGGQLKMLSGEYPRISE